MVRDEFGLNPDIMHEIFDAPNSNYQILTYNRDRGVDMSPKITVLAVAAFSEQVAFVPYVANRSGRRTPHLLKFFKRLEDETFSETKRKVLTIGANNIPEDFFRSRKYTSSNPVGFKLTAKKYRKNRMHGKHSHRHAASS